MLVLRWDAEIREATGGEASLNDVFRELVEESDDERFDRDLLLDVIDPFWSGAATELATHVDRGEPVAPHPRGMGPCVSLETTEKEIYDPGFDVDRSIEIGWLHDVDPESGAQRAGLRDGQEIVAIDAPGSPTVSPTTKSPSRFATMMSLSRSNTYTLQGLVKSLRTSWTKSNLPKSPTGV